MDNKATPNTFRLLVERRGPSSSSSAASSSSFPTLFAHHASLETIHPIYAFPQRDVIPSPGAPPAGPAQPILQPLVNVTSSQFRSASFLRTPTASAGADEGLPCDFHLLNLRTMRAAPKDDADLSVKVGDKTAVLFHRLGAECLQCRSASASPRHFLSSQCLIIK